MLSILLIFTETDILFPISLKVSLFSEVQDIGVNKLIVHCAVVVILAIAFSVIDS